MYAMNGLNQAFYTLAVFSEMFDIIDYVGEFFLWKPNPSVKDEASIQSSPDDEWTKEWLESRVSASGDEPGTCDTLLLHTASNGEDTIKEVSPSEKTGDENLPCTVTTAMSSCEEVHEELIHKTIHKRDKTSEANQQVNTESEIDRTNKPPDGVHQLEDAEQIVQTSESPKQTQQVNSDEKLNIYEELTEKIQQIHADGRTRLSPSLRRFSSSSLDTSESKDEGLVQAASDSSHDKLISDPSNNTSDGLEANCDINSNSIAPTLFTNKAELDFSSKQCVKKPDSNEELATKKFITSSWDLVSIVKLLYRMAEPEAPKVLKEDYNIQRKVFILSQGAFCQHAEGHYTIQSEEQSLFLLQEKECLLTMPLTHAEVYPGSGHTLILDNKMGRRLHFKCDNQAELMSLKEELQNLKCWQPECINLVHYPLKCHKNIIVIDLGSCSTRAGILMDQPTLPTLFFPSVCATNKTTGKHVYGIEALQPAARQNSTISFPLRPSVKIIKHSIDIDQVTGIFKKIFRDLRIDPANYTIQVCLPRSLSINAQNDLVKVLLEDLNVPAVSLAHQAILTMYAHNVTTGVVVDIGDRMDILPVIDGFIVEGGVTRLPYGGQRLIHHMKHALAQKHISLSNDIDSFVVQYITENLSYIAEDYERENEMAALQPQTVRKALDLQLFARDPNCLQNAVLDDARFKVPEGLFNPDLWGLDCPGVHKLLQKAIQASSVDARKKVAENIYLSGGVTMIPGFVERLRKEVTKLNEPRIIPKVFASNYRYHCTYIGACTFARMDVFPQVCVTREEYSRNKMSSLKKFGLCV